MGFCLECHKNPENHLRPVEFVYDLDWKAKDYLTKPENAKTLAKIKEWNEKRAAENKKNVALTDRSSDEEYQRAYGLFLKEAHSVNAKISCQTCHN